MYVSSAANVICFGADAGAIHLLSLSTKQWIASLKMNGTMRAATIAEDGNSLFSFGGLFFVSILAA